MTDALSIARKYFNVTELDAGEYREVNGGMINAAVKQYHIEGVGNMAIQKATAMLGLMKMDMMVITPTERDLPIFSYDIINAMGNHTLIIEVYDVLLDKTLEFNDRLLKIKENYSDLPDDDRGEHWYDDIKMSASVSKKGKKKAIADACDKLYGEYLEEFFKMASQLSIVEDEDAKRAKSAEYVNGLLTNGGPSTDQFVKMIGQEKTTEYFTKVIFGTAK